MEHRASYLLVGSFVLAAFAGLFAFVIWLARTDGASNDRIYEIHFTESVSGLGVGGEVRYRGIRIGKVVDIRIPENDPSKVAVRIEVAEDPALRHGDVAELSMQGITGLAFVNISGAEAGAPLLSVDVDDIALLPSRTSGFDQVMQGAPALLERANEVADRLATILGEENKSRVDDILSDVKTLTGTLAGNAPAVERLLVSFEKTGTNLASTTDSLADLGSQLDGMLKNIDSTVGQFNSVLQQADALAGKADTLMASANTALVSATGTFQTTTDAVGDIGARVDGLMTRAEGTLADTGEAARAVSGILGSVDSVLQEDGGEGAGALIEDLRGGVNDMAKSVRELPDLIAELRATAKSFDDLATRANGLVSGNQEAIDVFMGDGLNEFYRFLSESRRLVGGLTRISDRLEREGARFLLPANDKDGYVPERKSN